MITTEEEYLQVKKRVEKGAKVLEKKFLSDDPKIRRWVEAYTDLANQMLMYEIEHDLLPI